MDAVGKAAVHMSVTLEFEHEDVPYILERHVQADRPPSKDGDLKETVRLRKNGLHQPTEDIPEIVGSILHERIARFFLFDGEMLDEYEALLRRPDRGTDLVKASIEQILGLPALELTVEDLAGRAEHAEKRQLRTANLRQKNQKLATDAEQAQDRLEGIERDVAELRRLCAEQEQKRDALYERRKAFSDVEADVRQLGEIEGTIDRLTGEQQSAREQIRHLVQGSWWLPITTLAKGETERAQEEVVRLTSLQSRIDTLQRDIEVIAASIDKGSCGVCGQSLVREDQREALTRETAEKKRELGQLRGATVDVGEPLARIRQMKPFVEAAPLDVLTVHEKAFRRVGIEIRRLTNQAEDIRDRVKGHNRTEIRLVETEYEECVANVKQLTRELVEAEKTRDEVRETVARLRREIARLPEADPWIATEAALYRGLESLFQEAIGRFRDRLRVEVEKEATKIFRDLTTEKEYARLSINEQYGLTILDSAGRIIRDRSAGAEQVVALALIGALNRCALREGPVVMDTPFGRLDVTHRENILRFIPTLGPQVILLVQSGELNPQRDLDKLRDRLSREFRIERDGSPTRSRIVPLTGRGQS
jgi:DNA sulfur modification protein DndD